MSEIDQIFEQLSPAKQDQVLNLARALLAEQQAETATGEVITGKRGRPKSKKTGVYREVRMIRNRPNGEAYQWAYDVTYQNGKRVHSKSVGMVAKLG